jgi:hypothetical protein
VTEHQEGTVAAKRKRPFAVAIPLNRVEKAELQRAAAKSGLALSTLIRVAALTAVQRSDELTIAPAA